VNVGQNSSFLLILSASTAALLLTSLFFEGTHKQANYEEAAEVVSINPPRGWVEDGKVEIILTGDVMLGRTVMTKSLDLGDPTYPFKKVAERLRSADLVFVNLENPIVEDCPRHYEGFKFCADPKMVEGLVFAGVDVVNLANNHTLNYGHAGLDETKKILGENGIAVTGVNNLPDRQAGLTMKQLKNATFGFLGFNFVENGPSEEDLNLVYEAKESVDVLIVGVHWGVEYTDKPTTNQREWARELVEAGADVIAGHHPHWIQDVEQVGQIHTRGAGINPPEGWKSVPVYYSLGNFVFDQMWSEKTRRGMVVELIFDGKQLISQQSHKTYMSSWAQPEFLTK